MKTKFAAAALAAALLLSGPALSKTFLLPDADKAAAMITLPDAWEPEEIENGVQATSADAGVYVAAEAITAKGIEQAVEAGIDFFVGEGIEIDGGSMRTRDYKINGMDAREMLWTGRDKEGPTNVSLTLVHVTGTRFLMLTYWADEKSEQKHLKTLVGISDSIKSTK